MAKNVCVGACTRTRGGVLGVRPRVLGVRANLLDSEGCDKAAEHAIPPATDDDKEKVRLGVEIPKPNYHPFDQLRVVSLRVAGTVVCLAVAVGHRHLRSRATGRGVAPCVGDDPPQVHLELGVALLQRTQPLHRSRTPSPAAAGIRKERVHDHSERQPRDTDALRRSNPLQHPVVLHLELDQLILHVVNIQGRQHSIRGQVGVRTLVVDLAKVGRGQVAEREGDGRDHAAHVDFRSDDNGHAIRRHPLSANSGGAQNNS